MRSYADNLKKNKFKLDYVKIEDKDFKDDYFKKLKRIIQELLFLQKIRRVRHKNLNVMLPLSQLEESQI